MMRFWLREIAGWLLVALGLYIFFICFAMIVQPNPFLIQAGPLTVIGIFVFRGGIHLLKVAVAARICTQVPGVVVARTARGAKPPSER